ncbi:MAG: AAA family ATPase [Bacteroidota bacterium]
MSNHIDHIEITNFKSIRHAKIEGCKRINVFIGYPNVGKSNILEAISTGAYLNKSYEVPFSQLVRLGNTAELFFDGATKNVVQINLSNEIESQIEYISVNEFNLKFISQDPSTSNEGDKYFATIKQVNFKDKRVSATADSTNGKTTSLKIKSYHFEKKISSASEGGDVFLNSPGGENLASVLQFNKEFRKEVSDLFKEYNLKLTIDQETNSIKALKQLDDETIFLIPFYQMADTLQRLIFHKAAIMSNDNTVLLFEEPEAHMFPPYISNFTGDIIHDKIQNQYFISTHSPFVLNDLMEDAKQDLSIYAVGLKNGETTIKRITDEEMHEIYQYGIDLFFNLEDYLKDDQGGHSGV